MVRNDLSNIISKCEYYNLSEEQTLDVIEKLLHKNIYRSTYYNHKKKLYEDEIFQTLKKSIYKSKLLKYLLLYLDDKMEFFFRYLYDRI